jgi:hypothetical protein
VSIAIYGMGVLMLGILMEGKAVTTSMPQMETLDGMEKDGVGPIVLRDNKEDITRVTPIMLFNGFEGSTKLEDKLGPDIM